MLRRLATITAIVALLACFAATADAASGWTIQPTPNPANGHFNTLSSVACTSTSACVAAGTIGGQIGLSELWNGSKWRLQPVAPFGQEPPELLNVSCPVAANCMATTLLSLTELWNGSAWAIKHLASPAPSFTSFEMPAVSCVTSTDCVGFGAYTANRTCAGVAEIWNGSTWAVQSTVPGGTPSPSSFSDNFLDGVSCPVADHCTATGSFFGSGTGSDTLAEAR